MRIDAYQIFASGYSESRLLEALEANIQQVILLNVSLSRDYVTKLPVPHHTDEDPTSTRPDIRKYNKF